jgi:hypothetical protein
MKVPVKEFMSGLGKIAWIGQTRTEPPAASLLACRGQNPSEMDIAALRNLAAYYWWSKELGITFYEGPPERDIRKPMPFHGYADSGENSHIDGSAQQGIIFKAGLRGHPGEPSVPSLRKLKVLQENLSQITSV